MPRRIAPDVKELIDQMIMSQQYADGQVAATFKVSKIYVRKRRMSLIGNRTKTDQGDTPKDTKPRYKTITPAHGRGQLVSGAHPNGGRPKGSKPAKPISLEDVCLFYGQINPASVKPGEEGETYFEQFLKGCLHHAIKGNEAFASMILSAVEKGSGHIKLTIENAAQSDAPKALADPLFSAMDDERLRLEALRVLEKRYQAPIEAEYSEVPEE